MGRVRDRYDTGSAGREPVSVVSTLSFAQQCLPSATTRRSVQRHLTLDIIVRAFASMQILPPEKGSFAWELCVADGANVSRAFLDVVCDRYDRATIRRLQPFVHRANAHVRAMLPHDEHAKMTDEFLGDDAFDARFAAE